MRSVMTDGDVLRITGVREEWDSFRVNIEGGVFDASKVAPGCARSG
ncbi:hypothetical protein G7085_17695 [Tessaracoccus sp. HDW20]|nr:hypothetical protein [Tessaracoccus coleopterorum]NHB85784.1 hypothetical protein [Tessaracoccus coleopterorum]